MLAEPVLVWRNGIDLMVLTLTDKVSDGCVDEHGLAGEGTDRSRPSWQEAVGDDAFQNCGKLRRT